MMIFMLYQIRPSENIKYSSNSERVEAATLSIAVAPTVVSLTCCIFIWSFKVSWSVFSPPMATSLLASFKSTGPGGSCCKLQLRVNIFSGGSITGQYSVVAQLWVNILWWFHFGSIFCGGFWSVINCIEFKEQPQPLSSTYD